MIWKILRCCRCCNDGDDDDVVGGLISALLLFNFFTLAVCVRIFASLGATKEWISVCVLLMREIRWNKESEKEIECRGLLMTFLCCFEFDLLDVARVVNRVLAQSYVSLQDYLRKTLEHTWVYGVRLHAYVHISDAQMSDIHNIFRWFSTLWLLIVFFLLLFYSHSVLRISAIFHHRHDENGSNKEQKTIKLNLMRFQLEIIFCCACLKWWKISEA